MSEDYYVIETDSNTLKDRSAVVDLFLDGFGESNQATMQAKVGHMQHREDLKKQVAISGYSAMSVGNLANKIMLEILDAAEDIGKTLNGEEYNGPVKIVVSKEIENFSVVFSLYVYLTWAKAESELK